MSTESKFVRDTLLLACIAFAVTGCLDPKEASKGNFKKVFERLYEKQYARCVGDATVPYDELVKHAEVWSYDQKHFFASDMRSAQAVPEEKMLLPYLASVGLMTKIENGQQVRTVKQPFSWSGKATKEEYVFVTQFALTDFGRQYVKNNQLCLGTKRLVDIIEWTDPAANASGEVISAVKAKYSFDFPNAIQMSSPEKQKYFFGFVQGQPSEEIIKLVRVNDGWRVR